MTYNSMGKWVWMIAAVMLLSLVPDLAWAGPFDPTSGDKSKELIIDQLFGPISGGGGTSPFSEVIRVFNGAVLIVGMILVAYTLIAGTMSTAHDGEVLGKRWSSMWIPIRTSLGAAAIFPLSHGFCFAQIIVVWLALQGVGIADAIWSSFVDGQEEAATTYIPPSNARQIRYVLNEMLKSSACAAAGDESAKLTEDPGLLGAYPDVKAKIEATGINYGPNGECGTVTVKIAARNKEVGGASGAFFNKDSFAAGLYPIHQQQLAKAHAVIDPLGRKIAQSSENSNSLTVEVNQTLNRLAQEWSLALQQAAGAAYESAINKNLMKQIKNDGWMMAGMWYIQFATAQNAVSQGVTAIPNVGESSNILKKLVYLGPIDSLAAAAAIRRAEEVVSHNSTMGSTALDSYSDSNSNFASKMISAFMNEDLSFMTQTEKYETLNQNPVMMASNLGQNLSIWGWSAWSAGVVLGVASGTTVAGTGVGASAATMISPMLTALAGTIIVTGAVLSTYIPMLPYILWIGVVFGWMVLLVEAVVAAPLWAVTHLAPDGDGVVGRGGQGYMLVLSLTLRPALMVLGFVAAIILMRPLGYIVNSTFVGAFMANANPTWWSFVQIITGCVLYTLVMVSIIQRVFALIHVLPDRLLRWIGGGGSNDLGQEAHGIESHTGAKVMAGAAASHQLGSAGQQGVQNARNLQAQGKQRMSSDASTSAQLAANSADNAARAGGRMENARAALERNPDSPAAQAEFQNSAEAVQQSSFDKAMDSAKAAVDAGAAARNSSPKDAEGRARRQDAMDRAADASSFLERARSHVSQNGRSGGSLENFAAKEVAQNRSPTSAWGITMGQMVTAGAQRSEVSSLSEARRAASNAPEQPSLDLGGGGAGDNAPLRPTVSRNKNDADGTL